MASEEIGQREEKGGLFTTTLKYKEDSSGMFVGQSKEFPFIIVKGKTVNELGRYVKRHIDVYFRTFPEDAKKIIQMHKTHNEESETEWKHEKLNISVPVKE
jgi:hypothetical protein